MNIFESINYERRLENFCTEILVGILGREENYELLERFCYEKLFLGIPEAKNDKSLKIESQVYYDGIDDDINNSYIDIQVTGESFLCFLEMKVGNNGLCANQLEKYDKVLIKKAKDFNLKPYLKFCSRKVEKISFFKEDSTFSDVRWYNIYRLIKEFNKESSEIINDFLLFLESKNMSSKTSLEGKNINKSELSLGHSLNFLNKLEIILNEIRQLIDEANKLGVKPTNEYLDFTNNRFGLHYQYIKTKGGNTFEGKNPETSLFIGFDFNNKNEENNINKVVWLWSSNYSLSNYKFDIPKQNCKQVENLKEETLENILNWFLQNEVLKQIL